MAYITFSHELSYIFDRIESDHSIESRLVSVVSWISIQIDCIYIYSSNYPSSLFVSIHHWYEWMVDLHSFE